MPAATFPSPRLVLMCYLTKHLMSDFGKEMAATLLGRILMQLNWETASLWDCLAFNAFQMHCNED